MVRPHPPVLLLAAAISLVCWAPKVESAEQIRIRPFVVGGTQADIADFPYQVGLLLTRNGNKYRCGGSIIAPNWVVTAAHCFVHSDRAYLDPADVEIRTGASEFYASQMVITRASKVIPHEDYDGTTGTHENDIALIKTATPLTGTPVVLQVSGNPPLSGNAVVTGWGKTSNTGTASSVLMKATLPLISNETCNQPESLHGRVTAEMLCAGDAQGGVNACQGDSGGPLVQTRRNPSGSTQKVQIGIVSWTEDGQCALPLKYNAFTRVSSYVDWIGTAIVHADYPNLSEDQVRLVAAASRNGRGVPDAAAAQQLAGGLHRSHRILDGTPGAKDALMFAADAWHDVILLKNGTVLTLYYEPRPQNARGRQGMGLPDGLTNVVAVGARDGWSYALKRDGTLVSWNSKQIDMQNEQESRNCHPDC
jgi:secreted trypsin-like serine protease